MQFNDILTTLKNINKNPYCVGFTALLFILLVIIVPKIYEHQESKELKKRYLQSIKENKFNCFSSLSEHELNEYYENYSSMSCEQFLNEVSKASPVELEILSPMNTKRNSYQQTYVKDDKVYIFGGNIDKKDILNSSIPENVKYSCKLDYYDLEIFDIKKKSFKIIPINIKNFMTPQNCSYDEILKLPDNRLFYKGATFDTNKIAFKKAPDNYFSFKTDEFKQLNNPRLIKTENLSNEERLYAYNCKFKIHDNRSLESFGCLNIILLDINEKNKYKPGFFTNPSDSYEAIKLNNNKILLISPTDIKDYQSSVYGSGESTIELYNPNTGQISVIKKHLVLNRRNYTLLDDGQVLFIVSTKDKCSLEIIIFNPEDNSIKNVKNDHYCFSGESSDSNKYLKPFALNDDYILLIPIKPIIEYACERSYPARLMNIKTGQITDLNNIRLSYPWKKLTRLDDKSYLITGGLYCNKKGKNTLVSDYAAILTLKSNN